MAIFMRTFIRQHEQISGSAAYDDQLVMTGAEQFYKSNLEQDLNFVRTQLRLITGETNWYDPLSKSISNVSSNLNQALSQVSGSFDTLRSFTGQTDRTDWFPDYVSTNRIAANDNLEVAIGKLDSGWAMLSGSSGIGGVRTYVGMGNYGAMPDYSSNNFVVDGTSLTVAIGALDQAIGAVSLDKVSERLASDLASGSAHTLPSSKSYTPYQAGKNMDVYVNGILMQANTAAEIRDYEESSATEVTFSFVVPKTSYISYLIRQ